MVNNEQQQRRGIYLLPNLFTTAGLFAGFYAIVASMRGDFEPAAMAIFVAMIMDGLDGRIARMTNTQSAFGAEYDSLVDMVAFGLAPALVVYQWALHDMGKLGWMVAFIYAACAALRLARFNTQASHQDKRYFQGLPSPAAAACMAGLVWLDAEYGISGTFAMVLALSITLFAGILMVSSMRYHSFKELNLSQRVPFIVVLGLVFIFALIAIDPGLILFSLFMLYALSGPAVTFILIRKHRTERNLN
jgi:CDP-diacylglycerol--serine O-phosphatidyltransferase